MKFTVDVKAILGVLVSTLGWVAVNGPTILPIIPQKNQQVAGTVIGVAGLVLTFFSHPPTTKTP